MSDLLRWGIIGPGNIAKQFANGVNHSKLCKLVAVASRTPGKADTFADEFNIPTRYTSYEQLIADPNVDAIYISTPHTQHPEWAIKCAKAGKHVLSEKPAGLNRYQTEAMIQAAREAGTFFMEAYMYRTHPQIAKVLELIQGGAIGDVKFIDAKFAFNASGAPATSRLKDKNLGGGGILDVGGYTVTFVRLIAGSTKTTATINPTKIKAVGIIGQTEVDDYAAASLEFANGIIAQVATGVCVGMDNKARIFGSTGSITVETPWVPAREGGTVKLLLNNKDGEQTIDVTTDEYLYGMEADTCAKAIAAGKQQACAPAMNWDDSLGTFAVLDEWRNQIGLTYPAETPEGCGPISGIAPLPPRPDHNMKYATVEGIEKPVSKFIFGCDNQVDYYHGAAVWDDFVNRGGNTFDTAWMYRGGHFERHLGNWMKQRGIRDQINILSKSAHTPNCHPEGIRKQCRESLERMQIDFAEMHILHRDNLDIPVGEFIDVLNELKDEGLIGVFGGSNWSLERFKEANEYAKANGKQPMTIMNNNLSLARMVNPVWGGCIAASEPEYMQYLEETQTAHMAWSSQARGFFTDRSAPDKLGVDQSLEHSWYSEDNFKRKDRAIELANAKGVLPINIAAAYVICQPFPSFALIGPRTLHENYTTMPGLDIELTKQELAYLDLRADSPE
ncbi:MAG TPA: oxidoreductase [Phycisphaerales bacterium]|nr:oxidoreductase [Phycisphaerales bacterium]HCD33361.1 oxidoreductase [Phycisphaerales bacterium]|tara:strand:- start:14551 stop:16569 length:2019 start_codon:yes stop_codon:yes gene_type:complete